MTPEGTKLSISIEFNGIENHIKIPGKLVLSNSLSIRTRIIDSIQPGTKLLKIDLSATRQVDGSGLGMLVALKRNMQSREGDVVLLDVSANVNHVLQYTGVAPFFSISSSRP